MNLHPCTTCRHIYVAYVDMYRDGAKTRMGRCLTVHITISASEQSQSQRPGTAESSHDESYKECGRKKECTARNVAAKNLPVDVCSHRYRRVIPVTEIEVCAEAIATSDKEITLRNPIIVTTSSTSVFMRSGSLTAKESDSTGTTGCCCALV